MQSYRNGLARLPERRKPSAPPATDEKRHSPPAEGEGTPTPTDVEEPLASGTSVDSDSLPLEGECAKARSVLNANIAACYVKLVRAHANDLREHG